MVVALSSPSVLTAAHSLDRTNFSFKCPALYVAQSVVHFSFLKNELLLAWLAEKVVEQSVHECLQRREYSHYNSGDNESSSENKIDDRGYCGLANQSRCDCGIESQQHDC